MFDKATEFFFNINGYSCQYENDVDGTEHMAEEKVESGSILTSNFFDDLGEPKMKCYFLLVWAVNDKILLKNLCIHCVSADNAIIM